MAPSKNPLPPPFTPSCPSTHTKNKDARPGAVDKPKPRRTPAEMQAIRDQQASDKQEKERNQEQAMKIAADIEDEQCQEDLQRTAQLNVRKPPVASFRPPPPTAGKDVEDDIGSVHTKDSALHISEMILPDGMESDDSDKDQYRPEDQEGSDEDEVESKDEVESEDEDESESEKEEVVSKKGKKAKPGRPKKFKKSNQPPSGLRSGWDSAIKAKSIAPANKSNTEDDDSLVQFGGMVGDDEDDEVERSVVVNDKGSKRGPSHYIEVVSSTPRTQREARGGSGKKWKLEHLPKGTSDVFTNQLVPLAKSLAGSLSPWEGLSKEQVQGLVDKIYGPAQHTVQDALIDPWGPLISYRLNNWRNGFGTKAAEGLKRYIKIDQAEFFNNHQVIADWGRLQNPLVLYTLALAHFAEWEDVPDPERLNEDEKPYGAFILALQAVQHALKAWTTGEYVEARGSANHFSADNYGDRTERKSDKGRTVNVLVRRATQYMPTVKALSKDHWDAIFAEISNILADNQPKRKRSRSASSRGSEAPKEEEAAQEYVLVSDNDK
ncbi:hypothetical protein BYT27DRAFT_7221912 [Phlegmacium glaucopus]|nr:hypothetical protein BYT27DRAFT_7227664 [Phlegmacium glaucopus]KAF8810556.1 hypothetical protein BYT27DRAFT_7221912 [Phlegmacium glaucopus]